MANLGRDAEQTDELPNRRKVSNIVVNSRALARFSIPYLIPTLLNAGFMVYLCFRYLRIQNQSETLNTTDLLNLIASQLLRPLLWGTPLLSLFTLGLWILFSHRIFGPVVPIRRHVAKLLQGNFDSRIRLRKNDEFQELANELNLLAEELKAGSSKKLPLG